MAIQKVLVSDLTGEQILSGEGVVITINDPASPKLHVVDASRNDDLVRQMLSVARPKGKTGRPKAKSNGH